MKLMGTVKNASAGSWTYRKLALPISGLCFILFDLAGHPERRSAGAPEPSSLVLIPLGLRAKPKTKGSLPLLRTRGVWQSNALRIGQLYVTVPWQM